MVMGLIFIRHTLKLIYQPVKDWKNVELETTGIKMAYNSLIAATPYRQSRLATLEQAVNDHIGGESCGDSGQLIQLDPQ